MNKPVETWALDDVTKWLSEIGLAKYIDLFSKHEITGDILLTMKEKDLSVAPLNVTSFGAIRKFGIRVEKLKSKNKTPSSSTAAEKSCTPVSGETKSSTLKTPSSSQRNRRFASDAMATVVKSPIDFSTPIVATASVLGDNNWNPFRTENTVDKEKFSFPYWLPKSQHENVASVQQQQQHQQSTIGTILNSTIASSTPSVCDMDAFFRGELDLEEEISERAKPKTKRLKQIKREYLLKKAQDKVKKAEEKRARRRVAAAENV